MRPVRTQTGARVSRLGPATETKRDRSEFNVRPVSVYKSNYNVKAIRSSWETSGIISFKCKSLGTTTSVYYLTIKPKIGLCFGIL